MSLPSRGAWIEMALHQSTMQNCPSLPSRGAWIEIWIKAQALRKKSQVAPLAGSVDRN